jgi:hypothetical protein
VDCLAVRDGATVESLIATVPDVCFGSGNQFFGGLEIGFGVANDRGIAHLKPLGTDNLIRVENRVGVQQPIRLFFFVPGEAHRSQYDLIDGLARNMRDALPNASFIGFTGTPIEKHDANTRAVFGDYVSVYDIQQAVRDKATVPIYYESRIAKLALNESELPLLDEEIEELTEDQEFERREKMKTKWAALEALVGTPKRLRLIAEDLVEHFERRREAMEGKGMVVCMSRRICVDLYNEIIKLRPDWHDDDDEKGVCKIVMTGSASDDIEWQPHIRNKRNPLKHLNQPCGIAVAVASDLFLDPVPRNVVVHDLDDVSLLFDGRAGPYLDVPIRSQRPNDSLVC